MFRGQHDGSEAIFESIGAKGLGLSVVLPTFCRDRGPGFGRDLRIWAGLSNVLVSR